MLLRWLYPVPARLQRVIALGILVVYLPSAGLAFAYAASARPAGHPVVYAIDAHHHILHSGARLRPGQRITIYARGFAGHAPVQTVDAGRRAVGHVRANGKGVAHVAFRVPTRTVPSRSRFVALDGAVGRVNNTARRGNVQVTVPLFRKFAYRVGPKGQRVEGIGAGHGTAGGLASTGIDILAFVAAGALAIVLGAVALGAGRCRPEEPVSRRRARATAPRRPRGWR